MKRLTLLAIFTFMFVVAANNSYSADKQTKAGEMSILWNFNGLSEISIDDSYLGMEYLFADNMGIWADLKLGFITNKAKDNDPELADNTFGFDIGFIYYMFHKGNVAFYLSPQFGLETKSSELEGLATYSEKKITNTSFRVGCSFGAEWWAWDNVSVGFSTYLGFVSTNEKHEYPTSTADYEKTSTSIGTLSRGGKICLSFYFN
jgi:hypothetical protein